MKRKRAGLLFYSMNTNLIKTFFNRWRRRLVWSLACMFCACLFLSGCKGEDTIVWMESSLSASITVESSFNLSSENKMTQSFIGDDADKNILAEESLQDASSGKQNVSKTAEVFYGAETGTVAVSSYVKQKMSEGYRFVSSTQEGIAYIQSVISQCSEGVKICFEKGSVDIEALEKAAFLDYSSIGDYHQINLCGYSGHKSECELNIEYEWYSSEEEENYINNKIKAVLSEKMGSTEYETIRNIHDYICGNVDYCYDTAEGTAQNYSAYDALFGRKAVCSGYALLFQKFMDEAGINCVIAAGERDNGNGELIRHAWNLVNLEGEWYSVDCTWDGQGNDTLHDYFLQGANTFGYTEWGEIELAPYSYEY